jgi:hypothetical protein
MASTYTRKDSQFIWMTYKDDETGEWKKKATGYKKDNLGDRRQAELVARELTRREKARKPVTSAEQFDAWIDRWMADRYDEDGKTHEVYCRHWRRIQQFLAEHGITAPRQFLYRHVPMYLDWRTKTAGRNTAIHELKFFGVIMGEAVKRHFADSNPCVRMGLRKAKQEGKEPWTDEQISKVSKAIKARPHWMRCTFALGLYQAARLRQIPRVGGIDFKRGVISYHNTKGDKPFTHPMDDRAKSLFKALVNERLAAQPEADLLCDLPEAPSVEWRNFLDGVGCNNVSHHGLRTTWITRACLAKVHMSMAKRFVNHGSTAVHEIYQRLSAADIEDVPAMIPLPRL